ncbi:LysR substrate-binding domain-containing protein [Methylobacterium aerolatum]|uniref:DNA-binding transcriptional LysR family regulator n=1 Tax=Methylobacterium aerolatum TaxID=418708 RepID=A0ABU0I6K9_9HYPH|nr:LysR substrate-binding domain-containing protein [Methylobacterium aerolatum]MDQ0449336.1 DNA-binding transcriptional LysR family regulator [Methylobacterium aerolatum]GJD36715.1 HTH-type transcriptional regulator PerR [Methylobacterium aerolatum]
MRRIPSFPALRAFEAAARLGSFARASDELCLTPSAVSHQIRALERHLGRALFRRENRRATLTGDGERLLDGLSRAFDTIEAACAELMPEVSSSLGVHCTPSFATTWLGPRLPGFVGQNPGIAIRLSSGAEPLDLTRHPEIDVAIAYGRPPSGKGLSVESLGPEEITALCRPDLAETDLSPGAVGRLTWLESSFSPVRWADWFALNGLSPPRARGGPAFDRGALVISAAVQGLGVALESLRFAREATEAGDLVRLGGDRYIGIRRDLHFLCWRTRDAAAPAVLRFREWILAQEQAGDPTPSPPSAAAPSSSPT